MANYFYKHLLRLLTFVFKRILKYVKVLFCSLIREMIGKTTDLGKGMSQEHNQTGKEGISE